MTSQSKGIGTVWGRIKAGWGITDYSNIYAGIGYTNFEALVGIGGFNNRNTQSLSVGTYLAYFFRKENSKAPNRPWYFKLAFLWNKEQFYEVGELKTSYIDLRIGREFNFGKRMGLSFDAGYSHERYYRPDYEIRDHFPNYISASVNVFYRIFKIDDQ